MKPDKLHTAAFSGHRSFKTAAGSLFAPDGGEDRDVIVSRLRDTIKKLADEGFTHFLCGMAEGFDLLAGETVLSLRGEYPQLTLIAVIPFTGQASRFDAVSRELYERVLSGCAARLTISAEYTGDCFFRRNDWLVDNASVLVCRFNGSKGGTEYTVRRAVRNGLRVINIAY